MSRMKLRLSALVPASLCLGFVLALLLPAEWLLNVFLWGLGLVIVLAVATTSTAKEPKPLAPGAKIVSYFVLGTSRPNAVIEIGPWSSTFLCVAAALLGFGGGIMWLARV